MASADDDRLITDLEQRTAKMRIAFDLYFMGIEKAPPLIERDGLQRDIRAFDPSRREPVVRFRFLNLLARFQTFDTHWQRTLKAISEGTYSRDRFKADLHEKQRAVEARGRVEARTESKPGASSKIGDAADAFLVSLGRAPTRSPPAGLRGAPIEGSGAPPLAMRGRSIVETPGAAPRSASVAAPVAAPPAPVAAPPAPVAAPMRGAPVSAPGPAAPMRGAPMRGAPLGAARPPGAPSRKQDTDGD